MMIDFALEAEREEGKPPRRSDLPGVPAALPADHDDDHGGAARRRAAGARHGHGLGAAAAARHRDRRRPDLSARCSRSTPRRWSTSASTGWRARFAAATVDAGSRASRPAERRMSISAPFIRRPVATSLLTRRARAGRRRSPIGCCRWRRCRRSSSRPSRSSAGLPGASPETMASVGRDAARAAVRAHRRRHRDDLDELARARPTITLQFDLEPQHRRRRARRAGGHQRRPRPAAGEPAEQSRPTARSTRPTRRS